jgi:hypothetical protein
MRALITEPKDRRKQRRRQRFRDRRKQPRFNPNQWACLLGRLARERDRLLAYDPTSPRIKATLPAVSLLLADEESGR